VICRTQCAASPWLPHSALDGAPGFMCSVLDVPLAAHLCHQENPPIRHVSAQEAFLSYSDCTKPVINMEAPQDSVPERHRCVNCCPWDSLGMPRMPSRRGIAGEPAPPAAISACVIPSTSAISPALLRALVCGHLPLWVPKPSPMQPGRSQGPGAK
jgi:hypothetical protein